jgi:hypothetical protein
MDKKIHVCQFEGCQAKFSRPYRLQQHIRVHQGEVNLNKIILNYNFVLILLLSTSQEYSQIHVVTPVPIRSPKSSHVNLAINTWMGYARSHHWPNTNRIQVKLGAVHMRTRTTLINAFVVWWFLFLPNKDNI